MLAFVRTIHTPMKIRAIIPALALFAIGSFTLKAQAPSDPAHIGVEIQPYYNSDGPKISIGKYSKGLASKDEKEFVATIAEMKQDWQKLTFPQMFVAAARLYDLGYRKESVYWFYTAQYRGRLFCTLVNEAKLGSIGDPAFEQYHAYEAFSELVGPYINGYAFGDPDGLAAIVKKVKEEGATLPDMKTAYPGVAFKNESEWKAANKGINDGLSELGSFLKESKAKIKEQRAENGMGAFSKLTSKDLPAK